jgi:TonB family protein
VRIDPHGGFATDSCAYPQAARERGDTGTVVLLIDVAADGHATSTQIESSSGSDVLDQAAASCVMQFGSFVPKHIGSRAQAGWFRMRFTWSFGDP